MMDVKKMASMGQKAMREKQNAAEKAFWPLKAGRPRQLRPSLLEAVHTGREAANRLYASVRETGLRVEDAGCVLVSVTKGGKIARGMGLFTPENQDSNDLEMARRILDAKAETIGVAFLLIDRERNNILMHGRPFEPKYADLVAALLDEWELDFRRGTGLRFD